jgi:hypothetical protein
LLVTNRTESRFGEKIAIALTKPFQYFTPTLLTTPIETLAKSMIVNTVFQTPDKVDIVDNNTIFEKAKLFDQVKS